MTDVQDHIINIKIHQDQFDLLYKGLLDIVFESDPKRMVELLYKTILVPFQMKGDQLAIILLDNRRQGIVAAFRVVIQPGGTVQSIETIPLSLTYNDHRLADIFKVKSSEFSKAVELAKSILQTNYGALWTLLVIDFLQISKLFRLLDVEPTKELIGKIARTFLASVREEKIKLEPIPEVVKALERIV
ncbi:MAG TPA: hypothetical protein VMV49_08365 [Candidatus Deferrimicrobium sp.]|nr:hypothetical protein [Candidatus Deferrimicrobium sp.]